MNTLTIATHRLDLVLESTAAVLARIEAMTPADRAEVSPEWLARVRVAVPGPWTHGFAVLERAGSTAVGVCGFKGPPDADGVVEVAYGIEPAYQGRGYAKETVSALVEFADQAGAQVVRAHTKPDNGPSTGVLAGCGFVQIGEVVDPEDGRVCRWERRVRPSTGRPAA